MLTHVSRQLRSRLIFSVRQRKIPMTTEPLARKSPFSDPTIWIPVGLAVGSVAGLLFHDVISGTVIGMMTGDVVAMLIQRRRKKKDRERAAPGTQGRDAVATPYAYAALAGAFGLPGRVESRPGSPCPPNSKQGVT